MQRPLSRRELLKIAALVPFILKSPRLLNLGVQAEQASSLPNIIIIVFDTLSANHMSLYGYPRETTPNLKRFADRATVFNNHYAGGNFTSSGTAALLTGAHTWTQRAFNLDGTVVDGFEHKTLFHVLALAGYYRAVYTHNWLVVELLNQFQSDISYWKALRELCLLDSELSDRLFPNDRTIARSSERIMSVRNSPGTTSLFFSMLEQFLVSKRRSELRAKYASLYPRGLPTNDETIYFVLEDAIDWINSEVMQLPPPFMGYFHLLPPHDPYNPRREFVGRFDNDGFEGVAKPKHPLADKFDEPAERTFRRHYDEMIAYADYEFGRLYDILGSSGLLKNTFLFFTSDHGELLERGERGHQNPLLYEGITRIPLVVSTPGQSKRVDVNTPTSCVDLLPTLAYIAGQPIPEWAEGLVLPTLGGNEVRGRSVFTVEAKTNAKLAPITKATISMVKDENKLIHYLGYGREFGDTDEVYDLADDPEEMANLRSSNPDLASEMRTELLDKLETVNRPYQRT